MKEETGNTDAHRSAFDSAWVAAHVRAVGRNVIERVGFPLREPAYQVFNQALDSCYGNDEASLLRFSECDALFQECRAALAKLNNEIASQIVEVIDEYWINPSRGRVAA